MKSQLFFLGIYLPFIGIAAFFQKVIVEDSDALCLDGTLGAYFISKGKNPTKWIIYFEGGGWCGANTFEQTIQSCYKRSKVGLGSSKDYPENFTVNDGILSDNPRNSFADFNKAYFKYCDGSGHQGTRSLPFQQYKGAKLYFRGNNLTTSKLQHLQNRYGLFSNSTQIMISGFSAGGLAAFTWADYIRNKSHHKNVYSVPDAGIFLDSINYQKKAPLSNTQIDPPNPQCVRAYPNQPYKCMLIEYLYPYISTPLFAVQSLYDSWSLPSIIGIYCANGESLQKCSNEERAYVQEYHKNTSAVLQKIGGKPGNGYWAPVCVNHAYMQGSLYNPIYAIPMQSSSTIDQALINWVLKRSGTHKHMDTGAWPDNRPCSGLNNTNLRWLLIHFFFLICFVCLMQN